MYIIKNAFRCIGRAKGRNILIGIIAPVIAISACIGLSIRQAAVWGICPPICPMTLVAAMCDERYELIRIAGRGKRK